MFIKTKAALAALTLAAAGAASAAPAPYPNSGIQNPVAYTFTAVADGTVSAFFAGSSAAFNEELGLLVNGVQDGAPGLPNHASAVGAEYDFDNIHAGDTLVFYINVLSTGDTWYSDPSLNADGKSNHIYSSAYAGDAVLPAGTYVAFEDLRANGGSDFNYMDETFVFTNVASTPAVPEPANAALLLGGLGLMGLAARRRRSR